jgi:monoamine oxidase
MEASSVTEMMGSGVTRRNFLRAVGITGGAGTMFATMGAMGLAPTKAQAATKAFSAPRAADFSLTGRTPASVVILGGGVAGLVSAYELGKAGYKCTIIEPRSRTGGRNFTARNGTTQTDTFGRTQVCNFSEGQYLNCGPARLAQWMVTLDYCRELGVPIQVFSNQNADAYLYNSSSGMTAPERWRTAKSDVYGYVSELLAKATSQGALDSELTSDDKDRLMSFSKTGALSPQHRAATPTRAAPTAGTAPTRRVPASLGSSTRGRRACRMSSLRRSASTSPSSPSSTWP